VTVISWKFNASQFSELYGEMLQANEGCKNIASVIFGIDKNGWANGCGVMKLLNHEEFYSYLYIPAHICGSCV
jgi:hypothetical protein